MAAKDGTRKTSETTRDTRAEEDVPVVDYQPQDHVKPLPHDDRDEDGLTTVDREQKFGVPGTLPSAV